MRQKFCHLLLLFLASVSIYNYEFTTLTFAQSCEVEQNGVCYYDGMSCANTGCFSPADKQGCINRGFDGCASPSAPGGGGTRSFCCYNPPPPPEVFSCTDQGGLDFACYSGSCPSGWVSASQNPNTSCAASSQTCCWKNPPPNCVDSDCNDNNCTASGQVCTITTNPCSCVAPSTPTCSSSSCGACGDCGSCLGQSACGWNGSACQSGSSSCPAGSSDWYWNSCATNVCAGTPPPPPPPGPTCGTTCVYQQGSACYSGNCLDGTNNCSFNNNCGFVEGCSAGSQTSCPVQGCGACNAPETA